MIFNKFFSGLSKTRDSITSGLSNVFSRNKIDDEFYDEIEEILVMSDVGITTSSEIIDKLRDEIEENKIKETSHCYELLINLIKDIVRSDSNYLDFEQTKTIVMVVGINGAGKTTTIGKLAMKYQNAGKKVLIAACDTFRAAATEQLEAWANKANVPIIKGSEGSDPGAILYDALSSATAKDIDIILCDTAGRLHNKKNLMAELTKLQNIALKNNSIYKTEILLVLDGTAGQNSLSQAKEFVELAGKVDGIIVTKLDGTSKGGMAIAVQNELHIPIKYIGVGESASDLKEFNSDEFVDAIFNDATKGNE